MVRAEHAQDIEQTPEVPLSDADWTFRTDAKWLAALERLANQAPAATRQRLALTISSVMYPSPAESKAVGHIGNGADTETF